jgi:hypothetical protein
MAGMMGSDIATRQGPHGALQAWYGGETHHAVVPAKAGNHHLRILDVA